jgi:hypothetical protein
MALINCMECQAEVSDSALQCPKCGVQLRKPKRTFIGKLLKWIFIAFNVLMPISIYQGISHNTALMQDLSGESLAGFQVGTGIGVAFLLGIWFVGDVILGLFVLFTRPKS